MTLSTALVILLAGAVVLVVCTLAFGDPPRTVSSVLATLLAGAVLLVYWTVIVVCGPVLTVLGGLVLAGMLLATFAQVLIDVLARPRVGAEDPRIRVPDPNALVPAYAGYYRDQVIVDLWAVVTTAYARGAARVAAPSVGGLTRWLLTGRAQHNLPLRAFVGWRLALSVPAGWAFRLGTAIGVTLATTVATPFLLVTALMVATVAALSMLTAGVLRVFDLLALTVRRIRLRCPYPGCYRRFGRPTYRCRQAGHRHTGMTPGRYGVFRRICLCGQTLPTLVAAERRWLGAANVDAFCPHCDRAVPDDLGSARLVHLPIVGGTSAGKTTLLIAMLAGLKAGERADGPRIVLASSRDERGFRDNLAMLRSGHSLRATTDQLPTAFLFYVEGARRRRRLVYLYDPKGEVYTSRDRIGEQEYLAHADGLLLVVDLFAAPGFRRRLLDSDEAVARAARPSPEDPRAVYDRTSGELTTVLGSGGRRRLPVAVVVTKADALSRLAAGHLPPEVTNGPPEATSGMVEEWLASAGFGWLVRNLDRDFRRSGVWPVSALRTVSSLQTVSALRQVGSMAATPAEYWAVDPLLWLLRSSGMRTKALNRAEWRT